MAKRAAIFLTLAFFAFCAAALLYFYFFASFPAGEMEVQTNHLDVEMLLVKNDAGLVHVEATERTDVQANLTKIADARLAWFTDSLLATLTTETKQDGGRLTIIAQAPETWQGRSKIDMQIQTPPGLPVEIDAGVANVTVRNLAASLLVRQRGASNIVLERLTGPANVEARAGVLRAVLGKFTAPIQLSLQDGRMLVQLTDADPGPLTITMTDGDLAIEATPKLNAEIICATTGKLFNQYDEGNSQRREGDPAATVIAGRGGATIRIDAGDADVTIQGIENLR
jgi:hypothetical protein